MTNESKPPFDSPPPGKYDRMTILPPAELGNATPEELTWPVVSLASRVNSTFLDMTPVRGNSTTEEETWPVTPTEGGVISPSRTIPISGSEYSSIYAPDLFRYAYMLLGDRPEAEEVVQKTFIAALSSRLELTVSETPATYRTSLLKLTRQLCYTQLRKRQHWHEPGVQPEQIEDEPDIATQLETEERASLLRAAISKLSILEQEVINLHYVSCLSASEIAEVLGVSARAVGRARVHLRSILEMNFPGLLGVENDK